MSRPALKVQGVSPLFYSPSRHQAEAGRFRDGCATILCAAQHTSSPSGTAAPPSPRPPHGPRRLIDEGDATKRNNAADTGKRASRYLE